MRVAVIIPAYNEATTIAEVVAVAQQARTVDEILVVDNGSHDATAELARRAGARVLSCTEKGKGQAMRTGVAATEAEVICFLDADLLNLGPHHIDALVDPVIAGTAGMTLGLFDRGPELNPIFLHALPRLTGQRAMRRELFESLELQDIRGYKVEAALNSRADDLDLIVQAFVCDGLWHRTKEEKDADGPIVGSARKVAMLAEAIWSYVSYQVVRPLRRRGQTVADADR